ncbi:hypothetical protein HPB48_007513 [Haemaphysalis longicornis]|uniref:Uncharacterized protein n=1 Tax=Haemaphysalis longicornis TaxID=44386 RepID=A0A9J6GJR9_HAELO|nr:hypothetical protein HPB48_007513 [Haemaphysalis longicornis]
MQVALPSTSNSGKMTVQVEGNDISPEEMYTAGWKEITTSRITRRQQQQREAASASEAGKVITAKKEAITASRTRSTAIKAARMSALPRDNIKIVMRPRGGFNVAKLGLVEVAAPFHLEVSPGGKNEDILCVNARQDIIVICTTDDERANRYTQVKELTIRGQHYEVWTYITAPHDTAKGVNRGIPPSETPEEIHVKIVNRNNPSTTVY